jgi:hypothetical protein
MGAAAMLVLAFVPLGCSGGGGGATPDGGGGGSAGGSTAIHTSHELNDWKVTLTMPDGAQAHTYDVNASSSLNEANVYYAGGYTTINVAAKIGNSLNIVWSIPGDLAAVSPITATPTTNTQYAAIQYEDTTNKTWVCQTAAQPGGVTRTPTGTYTVTIDSAVPEEGFGTGLHYELVHGTGHFECPAAGVNPGPGGTVVADIAF